MDQMTLHLKIMICRKLIRFKAGVSLHSQTEVKFGEYSVLSDETKIWKKSTIENIDFTY